MIRTCSRVPSITWPNFLPRCYYTSRKARAAEVLEMTESDRPRGSRPVYNARVKIRDGAQNRTIGAAWRFKEGEGLVATLDLIPPNWDGKFILVPVDDGEAEDRE